MDKPARPPGSLLAGIKKPRLRSGKQGIQTKSFFILILPRQVELPLLPDRCQSKGHSLRAYAHRLSSAQRSGKSFRTPSALENSTEKQRCQYFFPGKAALQFCHVKSPSAMGRTHLICYVSGRNCASLRSSAVNGNQQGAAASLKRQPHILPSDLVRCFIGTLHASPQTAV